MGIVQTDALVGAAQAEPASGVIAEITEQRWLALARDLISAGRPAAENPLDPDIPGRIIDDIAVPIERPRVERDVPARVQRDQAPLLRAYPAREHERLRTTAIGVRPQHRR